MWVNGGWDFELISYPLPDDLIYKINAIFIFESLEDDTLIWNNSSTGHFCSKSAYSMAVNVDPADNSTAWIWDINSLPKIKHFLWMTSLGKIPTFNVLHGRGMDISIVCPHCKSDVETPIHVLNDCPDNDEVWENFPPPCYTNELELSDWLKVNCSFKGNSGLFNIPLNVLFPFILWNIWTHRNRVIHGPPLHINSRSLSTSIRYSVVEFWASMPRLTCRSSVDSRLISWSPPAVGTIKLNTDGASRGNPGVAGVGGVFQDGYGS